MVAVMLHNVLEWMWALAAVEHAWPGLLQEMLLSRWIYLSIKGSNVVAACCLTCHTCISMLP